MIHQPHNALRPFVKKLWVAHHSTGRSTNGTTFPERIRCNEFALPDGHMHLVIRLSDDPIRIMDDAHPQGQNYGYAVIGGARASFYTRVVAGPTRAIGATLLPGAAQVLFGLSALDIANKHTNLRDVWGSAVESLRDSLLEIREPALQLELFEMYLLTRVPRVQGLHPAIAQALAEIHSAGDVRSMVSNSGFSHRRFIELFGHSVGLTPKRFVRVMRFQRMLKFLARNPSTSWTELALESGYSDQAHFNREFREFAGITPEDYKRAAPQSPGHVVLTSDEPPTVKPKKKRR